jgi:putative zinc finger/helix-turn-helix YgiT family protein
MSMKPFPWKCGECGQRAVHPATLDTYSAELDHDGRMHRVTVRQFPVARCERCGAIVLDDAANRRLSEALRAAAGLSQPHEIRAGRQRLGLTQKELADYIQIAEATLSRWETGAQIQQRSMDRLLRGFFFVPEFRRFLGAPDPGSTASAEPFGIESSLSREVAHRAIEPPPMPLLADRHPPR